MPRDEDSSYNYIDFNELARLLAQTVVATPAVVQAPANTAPSAPAVQQAAVQIAEAVAPIVAPTVPRQAILALAKEIADEVVTTPEIIKADTGVSVPPKVIDSIVSEVSDVIPQNVIDSIEKSLSNASAEQVVVPTPSQALDERSQAISEYKNFFGTGQVDTSTSGAEEPAVQPFTTPMTISGQVNTSTSGAKEPAVQPFTQPMTIAGQVKTSVPTSENIQDRGIEGFGTGYGTVTGVKKISDMTQAEIDAATKAAIAAGGLSTDEQWRLLGESAEEQNARMTEGYKNFLAKPIMTAEQIAGGGEVRWVREGAGGKGEWQVVMPIGSPLVGSTTNKYTEGIIPVDSKHTTGSDVGQYSDGKGNVTPVQTFEEVINNIQAGTITTGGGSNIIASTGPTGPAVVDDREKAIQEYKDFFGITSPTGPAVTGPATTGPAVQTYTASDGKQFTDQQAYVAYENNLRNTKLTADTQAAQNLAARQSAYDLLYSQFNKYGLGSLVKEIEYLIKENVSPSEFAIRLQDTQGYQNRFSANKDRIKKGLAALSPAEYIGLEDQYQNIMRNYGLPASYYTKDAMGTQAGFNNFISNDVSAAELEDRIMTAQKRILYANPEVSIALKTFYPDISNGDLLAYALDPEKGLEQIKRRITAAEIGASAVQLGLTTNLTDAEYLARYGVTKDQAQQGYRQVAEVLPGASKLGDIYANQGLGPYTQQTAEQEIFNVPGAAEAAAKRRKLSALEQAQFAGQAGTTQGALARERAGAF